MNKFKIRCFDRIWNKYKDQIIEDNQLWRFDYELVSSVDGADLIICSVKDEFEQSLRKNRTLIYCYDATLDDVERIHTRKEYHWNRFDDKGWEVTSVGDGRFSPMFMRVGNQTIENIYHLDIKGFRKLGYNSWKECKGLKPFNIIVTSSPWTRLEAKLHPERLYIFTDNLNRTSGNYETEDNSWYVNKYKSDDKKICYPSTTQAVIRGLHNAFPISTMRNQFKHQITELDLIEVTKIWDDEIQTILDAWNSGGYTEIRISPCQFGNGKYSRLINNRSFFNALSERLKKIGIANEFYPTPIIEYHTEDEQYKMLKGIYSNFFINHPALLYELTAIGNNFIFTDRFATTGNTQARVYAEILNEK
jgi:hypothetical protein